MGRERIAGAEPNGASHQCDAGRAVCAPIRADYRSDLLLRGLSADRQSSRARGADDSVRRAVQLACLAVGAETAVPRKFRHPDRPRCVQNRAHDKA